MIYTFLDAAGAVRSVVQAPDMAHVEACFAADPLSVTMVEGSPPDQPIGLETAKIQKLRELHSAALSAENNGFEAYGVLFNSDDTAQRHLVLMGIAAASAPNFSVSWSLADGSVRILNEQALRTVIGALAEHIKNVQGTARTLKAQVAAATTLEQVAAITWP